MKKILALLFGIPAVFAQPVEPTPMQLLWSIFAVAAIVLLFTMYHLHLEHRTKKKR